MILRAAFVCVAALAAVPLLVLPSPSCAQVTPAASQDSVEDAPASVDSTMPPLPIPPVPPRIAEGAGYEACLDMLATDPSGADAMATGMLVGGAAPGSSEGAQHCHALAQVELGNTESGAALLDRLATTSTAPAASRAVVFAQASQAWTMSNKLVQAYASASAALSLSPDDPELLIGQAIAGLALGHDAQAADDLTHALELDPKRVDALILRATAYRNLDKLDLAKADITAACALDPENPDGLLERGIIRQRLGDLAGARSDWEHAADLAPDTPTADLAQQNLALLEAGPRQ